MATLTLTSQANEREGRDMIGTVTISIGRCIGDEPMLASTWARFVDGVGSLVWDYAKEVHVNGARHVGVWRTVDDVLVSEDSVTWVADVDSSYFDTVRKWLGRFAHEFGQDAIAMTVGVTELVKPRKRV